MRKSFRQMHDWFGREQEVSFGGVLFIAVMGVSIWLLLLVAISGLYGTLAATLVIVGTSGLSGVAAMTLRQRLLASTGAVKGWQFRAMLLSGEPLPLSPQSALLVPFASLALGLLICAGGYACLIALVFWPVTLALILIWRPVK